MRRLRWLALILAIVVAAPVVGALVPRPLLPSADPASGEPRRRILVLANPIHTDIAFPAEPDVLAALGFLDEAGLPLDDPAVRWIMLGWGGREFYLETPNWSDLKAGPLFKGLTLDRAVMHVAVAGAIDPSDPAVTPIDVDGAAFERMLSTALRSFSRDGGGEPLHIEGRGYGPYDRFYEAEGRFSALVGCNTWTSAVLRQGGLRTGTWNPLPQSLAWSLALFNDLP